MTPAEPLGASVARLTRVHKVLSPLIFLTVAGNAVSLAFYAAHVAVWMAAVGMVMVVAQELRCLYLLQTARALLRATQAAWRALGEG